MPIVEKITREPIEADVSALEGITNNDQLADALIDAATNLGTAVIEVDKALVVKSAKALMTLMTAAMVQANINPVLAQRESHVAETPPTTVHNR